jgi:cell division protein FtsB
MTRSSLKAMLFLCLGIGLNIYFIYHFFEGKRGIYTLKTLEREYEAVEKVYHKERELYLSLEHRVNLLSPQTLDKDMLDERVRDVLNVGKPNEVIVVLDPKKE